MGHCILCTIFLLALLLGKLNLIPFSTQDAYPPIINGWYFVTGLCSKVDDDFILLIKSYSLYGGFYISKPQSESILKTNSYFILYYTFILTINHPSGITSIHTIISKCSERSVTIAIIAPWVMIPSSSSQKKNNRRVDATRRQEHMRCQSGTYRMNGTLKLWDW